MKEKEIRELFDNLDCEDTEKLLDGIDATGFTADDGEKKLDYGRIEKMVFEKAGLAQSDTEKIINIREQEEKERKAEIIRWKKYSTFAAVACFGFMLGILTMFAGSFLLGNKNEGTPGGTQVAEKEENENPGSVEIGGSEYDDSDEDVEEPEKDEIKDGKDEDGKDNKGGKGDKDDKNHSKDNENSQSEVKFGDEDKDEYTRMPSDDVDNLIENSTSEIDMDSFILKYENVDAMVEDSDCIVRGIKEESMLIQSEEKGVYDLVAQFSVNSILLDNLGNINESIRVNEGIKFYSDEEKIVHVGGYENMICGNEYILFLKKTSTKRYRIAGLIYGKVPVSENEAALEIDSSYLDNKYVIEINDIISEARDIYMNMEDANKDSEVPEKDEKKPEEETTADPAVTATPSQTPSPTGADPV